MCSTCNLTVHHLTFQVNVIPSQWPQRTQTTSCWSLFQAVLPLCVVDRQTACLLHWCSFWHRREVVSVVIGCWGIILYQTVLCLFNMTPLPLLLTPPTSPNSPATLVKTTCKKGNWFVHGFVFVAGGNHIFNSMNYAIMSCIRIAKYLEEGIK